MNGHSLNELIGVHPPFQMKFDHERVVQKVLSLIGFLSFIPGIF